jgi:hypothetical protein
MATLKSEVQSRFAYVSESPNLALICALLDPRYASLAWITKPGVKDKVWEALLKEALDVFNVQQPTEANSRSSCLISHIFQVRQPPPTSRPVPLTVPRISAKAVAAAVEDYKAWIDEHSAHPEFITMQPLAFWKQYQSAFPLMQHVARALFSVPPSSACVERAFSSTGILMDGRERLTALHLQQLAIIRDTLRQWKAKSPQEYCREVETLLNSLASSPV